VSSFSFSQPRLSLFSASRIPLFFFLSVVVFFCIDAYGLYVLPHCVTFPRVVSPSIGEKILLSVAMAFHVLLLHPTTFMASASRSDGVRLPPLVVCCPFSETIFPLRRSFGDRLFSGVGPISFSKLQLPPSSPSIKTPQFASYPPPRERGDNPPVVSVGVGTPPFFPPALAF